MNSENALTWEVLIAIIIFVGVCVWATVQSKKDSTDEFYFIGRGGLNDTLLFS